MDLVAWSLKVILRKLILLFKIVKEIEVRMFHPMLVYQTFEETSLTDLSPSRGVVGDRIVNSRALQKVNKWAVDHTTLQPLSHMLAEPLLKIGVNGPVLTVERHIAIVFWAIISSSIAYRLGLRNLAMTLAGGSAAFTIVVRTLITILIRSARRPS